MKNITAAEVKKARRVLELFEQQQLLASNKAFEKMTVEEKRVEIAKDVVRQIQAEAYEAATGVYLETNAVPLKADRGDLQKVFKRKRAECRVCAIGAGFVSAVRLFNKLNVSDLPKNDSDDPFMGMGRGAFTEYLDEFFPQDMLDQMESAFESNDYGYYMEDENERLEAIWKNIIKNKGEDFTEYRP